MNTVELFNTQGYVHLQDFLDTENCAQLVKELRRLVKEQETSKDSQCPLSEAIHGAACFDSLLEQLLPHIEQASGKRLYPTYSYARLYVPGDELFNHRDRPSCEISVTLTLGYSGKQWPIYMGDHEDKSGASEILMNVGDAVLYKGMEKWHWREKFEGEWQAQVFLHYVDKDGSHAEWKYDKRDCLTHKKAANGERLYTFYEDVLTPSDCDKLVELYTNAQVKREAPYIGDVEGTIDTSVRNVQRIMLPVHKGIGGRLVSVGLDANYHHWKFDVTRANQSEFLIYEPDGRYVQHIDTFINPHEKETRKITILAFLSDEFEGGKFFIMAGNNKIYPPQKKGTVVAFPSFLLHGVEDVTKGTRCSVVTWLVGPWFK